MIQGLETLGDGVAGGWRAVLAQLDGETRLYDLTIEGFDGPLWIESFIGFEGLSQLSDYRLHAVSTDAALDIGALRWRRTQLRIRMADGGDQMRSGHIRAVRTRRAEGGLARYELRIAPWNWLLTQQSHSRIWQDQPLADILGDVFAAYPDAQWAFAEGSETLISAVPSRPYCVQYRETDHTFISRLLAEEGLGWTYEENGDASVSARLLIFADSTQLTPASGPIRFHRAAGPEGSDAIQRLDLVRRLPTARASLVAYDPVTKRSQSASAESAITNRNSDNENAMLQLERYRWQGHGVIADSAEAERRVRLMQEAIDARHAGFSGEGNVRSLRAGIGFQITESLLDELGSGDTDRSHLLLLSMHCIGLNNLPSDPRHALDDLRRAAREAGLESNDLNVSSSLDSLLTQVREHGYASAMQLQPAALVWRPAGAGARCHQTVPGAQSAVVVDAGGNTAGTDEIHRDRMGRIRVRFHWQQDTGNDAAHTRRASCWLRTASRAAGPGRGASFVPRLGQEVLVGFLDNDIDQPIVLGALYNGKGEAGASSTPGGKAPSEANSAALYAQARDRIASAQGNKAGGNSPAWHGHSAEADGHQNPAALTGYKTQEFGGGGQGYNQLSFDDRDAQLRVQLKTTQTIAELNLGHLVHQADNHLGSIRGSGYELRTDAGGAIRASKGVLIESRRGQTPAGHSEVIGDFTAGTSLLQQAQSLLKNFDTLAVTHLATGLSASRGSVKAASSRLDAKAAPAPALTAVAQAQVSGADASPVEAGAGGTGDTRPVPHLGASVVALSAKAQLGVIAGQAIELAAGETIATLSGQDQDHAIGGSLTIHTGQSLGMLAGIQQNASNPALSLITAQGPLRLEAQNATMNLDAKQALKLVSVSQSLEAAAKTAITLTTKAGAMIRIEGGNIQIHCPGQITVHAAEKTFTGPTSQNRPLPSFPRGEFKRKGSYPFSV